MKSALTRKTKPTIHLTAKQLRNLKAPADLLKALKTVPKAKAGWDDITPIARRDWILAIITAKLPETRKRRIKKACSMLSHGKRRLCCFGGLNWLIKTGEISM